MTACTPKEPEAVANKASESVQPSPELAADHIYIGGTVITVNDAQPTAEALAVKDGKILAVGSRADIEQLSEADTQITDLAGKVLVPGFVDGHSHPTGSIAFGRNPILDPPPVGKVDSIGKIIETLQTYKEENNLAPGEFILGANYDDTLLKEQRHPTAAELDQVSTEHPVVVWHVSGHLAAGNHLALEKVGFTKDSPDPKGGKIVRDAEGNPTGLVEEQAVMAFMALMPPPTPEQIVQGVDNMQQYYASMGITTAQEGQTLAHYLPMFLAAADRQQLALDLVSYPKWTNYQDIADGKQAISDVNNFPAPAATTTYTNHLRIGGIKITVDGSPQGKTAYLSQPYAVAPAGQTEDYRGYPVVQPAELDNWLDFAYANDIQLLVHCNGDAAADMMISAVRAAQAKHGAKDLRPVMIHAQTVRADQLDAMQELGIIPSFFTNHTFYWGDWHRAEVLGEERAAFISPMRSAIDKGLLPTNHTDFPVVPLDQLFTMHTAVNRTTRSDFVLGPEQRVTPLEALKAITIWSARMYFEEADKGSLEPGKRADLVVLSQNPLTVDSASIKDIKVLETIKDGNTIFKQH